METVESEQVRNRKVECQICRRLVPTRDALPGELVRDEIAAIIGQDHPTWDPSGFICRPDHRRYRSRYVERTLEADRGELSRLEADVIRSLREHDLLARNLNVDSDSATRRGERVADRMAAFGGSWRFILIFSGFIAVWILINTVGLLRLGFDHYPYILLNLILSCLAAVQAPIIMMSQNRQEARDRLRAENDYRVNLKAELEIRHLNAKMDQLLHHQWHRLLEIQEIQLELMEELGRRPGGRSRRPAPADEPPVGGGAQPS